MYIYIASSFKKNIKYIYYTDISLNKTTTNRLINNCYFFNLKKK